jgi:hypothetical protein
MIINSIVHILVILAGILLIAGVLFAILAISFHVLIYIVVGCIFIYIIVKRSIIFLYKNRKSLWDNFKE